MVAMFLLHHIVTSRPSRISQIVVVVVLGGVGGVPCNRILFTFVGRVWPRLFLKCNRRAVQLDLFFFDTRSVCTHFDMMQLLDDETMVL